jgi:hypothetical protein
MTAAMTTLTEWQDRYIKLAERVQAPVARYTARVAEAVAEYVPQRPDWALLDRVPTMTEFVDNQLKFRKRVVDEQAAFARKLMKAMRPALVKLESKAPARADRPAPARRAGVRAA